MDNIIAILLLSIYTKNNYVGTLNYDPLETIDFSFELVSV